MPLLLPIAVSPNRSARFLESRLCATVRLQNQEPALRMSSAGVLITRCFKPGCTAITRMRSNNNHAALGATKALQAGLAVISACAAMSWQVATAQVLRLQSTLVCPWHVTSIWSLLRRLGICWTRQCNQGLRGRRCRCKWSPSGRGTATRCLGLGRQSSCMSCGTLHSSHLLTSCTITIDGLEPEDSVLTYW